MKKKSNSHVTFICMLSEEFYTAMFDFCWDNKITDQDIFNSAFGFGYF